MAGQVEGSAHRSLVIAAVAALAAGASAAQAQTPGKAPVIERPDWIERPRNSDLLKSLPAEAMRLGVDGKAVIGCEVTRTGAVQACTVLSEDPPGVGFGAAAVRLAGGFRMSPQKVDGRPTDTRIAIPVAFDLPQVRAGQVQGQPYVTDPVWIAGPTRAQVVAAYPSPSRAAGTAVRAVLDCAVTSTGGLDGCRVADGAASTEAGQAALGLAGRFRMDPVLDGSGRPRTDLRVRTAVHFTPDLLRSEPRLVDEARWAYLPKVAEMQRVFPVQAKAAGLKSGLAVLDCAIQPGGGLGDCKVARETPAAMGFGAAALAVAPGFALEAWNNAGRPVDGDRVRLPIRYKMD